MQDPFNRHITYLRISVTDRCNLKCDYCMPYMPVSFLKKELLLTVGEIVEIARVASDIGINKIRLTGGEPLIRGDIVDIVKGISGVKGIEDLSMTTNGILLKDLAGPLALAGLNRINISLDSINHARYRKITRVGDVEKVLEGIQAAKENGLHPVKINCVIERNIFEKDAREVAEFCQKNELLVRFIPKMDLGKGKFSKVIGGEGGNCKTCNRLRITSGGMIKPCLFSNKGYNIRETGIRDALVQAIRNKPKSGSNSTNQTFYNIGG